MIDKRIRGWHYGAQRRNINGRMELQATNVNRKLFTTEDGSPLTFVLSPCSVKAAVRKLIEDGGGELTSKYHPGAIRLTDKRDSSAVGYLHIDYIFECVKQNQLLPVDGFKVTAENSKIIVKSGVQSGRSNFTAGEDQAIIDFIKKYGKESGTGSVTGNYIWKNMEKEKVTRHPWQSMRSRFLKHLNNTGPKFSFNQLTVATCKGKEVPFVKLTRTAVSRKKAEIASTAQEIVQESDTDIEVKEALIGVCSTIGTGACKRPRLQYKGQKATSITSRQEDNVNRRTQKSINIAKTHRKQAKLENKSSTTSISKSFDLLDHLDITDSRPPLDRPQNTAGTKRTRKIPKQNSQQNLTESSNLQSTQNREVHQESNISDLNKRILEFVDTNDGLKMLKIIKFHSKMKLFMIRFGLDFMAAFRAIFFSNGNLDEAASSLVNGTLKDGSLPWNYEDDQVLMLGECDANRSQIEKLIKKRGLDSVKKRLEFLG